jgi:hypothetical protein
MMAREARTLVGRIDRLTAAQAKTNRKLGETNARLRRLEQVTDQRLSRIEGTLRLSSRLFEMMNDRLETLEIGQQALVEGQQAIVAAVERVVVRLDRLVEAGTRDRAMWAERMFRLERRVDALERRD